MTKADIDSLLTKTIYELDIDLKELFEQKLDEYDITKTKLLSLLNIDKDSFDDIINGTAKQPNLISVIKIVHFLGIDLHDALPAILKNQPPENIKSLDRAKKVSFVAGNFDIKKLYKAQFFEETDDIDYIYSRILSYFGYTTIDEYEKHLVHPLQSKTRRLFSDKMKDFWVKSAYQCFKNINNPNEYDREALKDIIVKIKPYCQDVEKGLYTVCKALYNVGVTVIVQNHLTLTQVRGGTFVVNGKPCIVLTDLNKRYTTLWETLIHELHHVLFDLDAIAKNIYHVNGDADLFLIEDKAENFSMEYFCSYERYNFIKPHINTHFIVEKYAKEWEIHSSFIYSSFRYFQKRDTGKNYYGAFTTYFPELSLAVKKLKPINWREGSLLEVAEHLKLIFELK